MFIFTQFNSLLVFEESVKLVSISQIIWYHSWKIYDDRHACVIELSADKLFTKQYKFYNLDTLGGVDSFKRIYIYCRPFFFLSYFVIYLLAVARHFRLTKFFGSARTRSNIKWLYANITYGEFFISCVFLCWPI